MDAARQTHRSGIVTALAAGISMMTMQPAVPQDQIQSLTRAYNRSGHDLFRVLAAEPGNVVISPFSIGTAMAMVLSGARGDTEVEMRKVLRHTLSRKGIDAAHARTRAALMVAGRAAPACPEGFVASGRMCEAPAPENADEPCPRDANRDGNRCVTDAKANAGTLRIANALMLVNPAATIADEYRDAVRSLYGAEIFSGADLATVNNWVSDKTEKKIPKIIERLNPNDSHVVLNAIYFNAPWAQAFARNATRDRDFHLTAAEKVDVPTMSRTAAFAIQKGDGFSAVRIPYGIDALSMIVVRPDAVDGIDAVIKALDGEKLEAFLAALRKAPQLNATLSLPRFKFEFKSDLIEPFKSLGLSKVFDAAQSDLSGMTGLPRDKAQSTIDQIAHRAVIDVAEEGTEAAAATAAVITTRAMTPGVVDQFNVDRPFLFVIADDNTGAVLFAGRVSDPRS